MNGYNNYNSPFAIGIYGVSNYGGTGVFGESTSNGVGIYGSSNGGWSGYFGGGLGVNSEEGYSVDETEVIDENGVLIPANLRKSKLPLPE